jgi:hypothetical protein
MDRVKLGIMGSLLLTGRDSVVLHDKETGQNVRFKKAPEKSLQPSQGDVDKWQAAELKRQRKAAKRAKQNA